VATMTLTRRRGRESDKDIVTPPSLLEELPERTALKIN